MSSWPVSGLWVIGLFIGIDMIFDGWTEVMLVAERRTWRRIGTRADRDRIKPFSGAGRVPAETWRRRFMARACSESIDFQSAVPVLVRYRLQGSRLPYCGLYLRPGLVFEIRRLPTPSVRRRAIILPRDCFDWPNRRPPTPARSFLAHLHSASHAPVSSRFGEKITGVR